jgi:hypothetical protein
MHEQSGTRPVLIGESNVAGTPKVADVLAARHSPANPFFRLV